jgi:hypothetical protein
MMSNCSTVSIRSISELHHARSVNVIGIDGLMGAFRSPPAICLIDQWSEPSVDTVASVAIIANSMPKILQEK